MDLLSLLMGTKGGWAPDVQQPGVRPDYGLSTATGISPAARSAYERTMAPGERRSSQELQDMLAEVILAAGSGALPAAGAKGQARQAPARVRPGYEKQFKEWFGGSKVAGEKGEPLTVYHGTADPISAFRQGAANKKDTGWLGEGFYFTNSPRTASDYTALKAGPAPNVIPAHLKMKNPLIVGPNAKEPLMLAERRGDMEAAAKRTKELKALGYDGVILDYGQYAPGQREYVVFEPTQIKSATGNRGTYDPNNPRIDE